MIAMMKRITYFALLIVLLELIVNLNVFVSSLSSAKQYGERKRRVILISQLNLYDVIL